MYAIVLYRDPDLKDDKVRFKMQVSTGFLLKIAKRKYLVSTLCVIQNPELQALFNQKEAKQLVFASFGNRDLTP